MISEHQAYMVLELLVMCVLLQRATEKTLMLVSREVASILRPHLFRRVHFIVEPEEPIALQKQRYQINLNMFLNKPHPFGP